MIQRSSKRLLFGAVLGATFLSPQWAEAQTRAHQDDVVVPRILLDQPPRAVEYQLSRLSNEQLVRVERRDDDVRYRPVYYALLTRKGLPRKFRDEALAALTEMDETSHTRVLLVALARLPVEDPETVAELLRILFAQPAETLRGERETLVQAIDEPGHPLVLRGSYGATMIADGDPGPAWRAAAGRQGHLVELLRGVPHLGDTELRARLFQPIAALLDETQDAGTRAEAIAALAWTRRDTSTFGLLAREFLQGSGAKTRAAAIRALQLIPESSWPPDRIEPLAQSIVALVSEIDPDARTEPSALEAIELAERLAAALPDEPGRTVRRELRALGVQVVRIEAVPEQLLFDLKWFVVEAGKPVQIVLYNPDAMPHNLVVSRPGSLQEVGMAALTMPLPADPDVKPYVPDSPLVLHATGLLEEGEMERLGFTAPQEPGEYLYICTVPGHWARMYGVMLVVEDLEAWEANPTVPTDPMTNQPFESQRN